MYNEIVQLNKFDKLIILLKTSMVLTKSKRMLDTILDIVLGEGKGLALTVSNNPLFSGKLKFHFDTRLAEGIITKN